MLSFDYMVVVSLSICVFTKLLIMRNWVVLLIPVQNLLLKLSAENFTILYVFVSGKAHPKMQNLAILFSSMVVICFVLIET